MAPSSRKCNYIEHQPFQSPSGITVMSSGIAPAYKYHDPLFASLVKCLLSFYYFLKNRITGRFTLIPSASL